MEIYEHIEFFPGKEPVYIIGDEKFNRKEFERELQRQFPRAEEVTLLNVTSTKSCCDEFVIAQWR